FLPAMNHPQLTIRHLALSLALLCNTGTNAQTTAPAPDKNVLKARLAAQEQRANLLLDEIKFTDSRIEDRVDDILSTLRMVGDSKDSRTKVSRMKEQTITDLQKNITYYQQKRAWLEEQMRRPTFNLTTDEKRRIIARFNERIEKRVNQILEMNKSLPKHQDFERYKTTSDSWYGGVSYVESDDYRQNQMLTSHSNTQRDKVIKGLQSSIERLERQNRTLAQQQLAASNEELKRACMEEQRKNDELIKTRRAQLKEVFTSSGTPTRPISVSEAQALDNTMKKSIDSLRRDFTTLFQHYWTWIGEQSSVNNLKAALAKS
ncbi:MAG: hypothetical protein K8R87_10335, partial [Verrucomicrobia bacterium]|nr:hypothetical protein [Verrucomicrobiota bacterium]